MFVIALWFTLLVRSLCVYCVVLYVFLTCVRHILILTQLLAYIDNRRSSKKMRRWRTTSSTALVTSSRGSPASRCRVTTVRKLRRQRLLSSEHSDRSDILWQCRSVKPPSSLLPFYNKRQFIHHLSSTFTFSEYIVMTCIEAVVKFQAHPQSL